MRSQPADIHRGQRPCAPREQAGHMTASTPFTAINFSLASRGPSTLALLVDRQHHRMGRRIDIEADDVAAASARTRDRWRA